MPGDRHQHFLGDPADPGRRLGLTLALVSVYMVAEFVGGILANSLALIADAGHMLSDAGALAVALFASRVARRPPSSTHTFGYQRAEILAALANSAILLAIAGYVVVEAVERLGTPAEVHAGPMLLVAIGGLIVNLVALFILRGGRSKNLNIRGAWLHVVSDTLGSVSAIAAGFFIAAFGWNWADPVASVAISALVLYSAWLLLRETVAVLMQAVPARIELEELARSLASLSGVLDVHDLHVWSVTPGRDVVSAHLTIDPAVSRREILNRVQERLREKYDLHHSTIQLDCPEACEPCEGPM